MERYKPTYMIIQKVITSNVRHLQKSH